jgi:hypothetical protein
LIREAEQSLLHFNRIVGIGPFLARRLGVGGLSEDFGGTREDTAARAESYQREAQ